MRVHVVTSLDLPELSPYRTLRRPQEHLEKGIFVSEGEKVVRRLLLSGLRVQSILTTRRWLESLPALEQSNAEIYVADQRLLEQIVGFPLHQGVMAVAHVPEQRALDDLVSDFPEPFLLVALDGVVSAENVGLIVRNCGAFNVDAILIGSNSSSPYLRRAVRNSMGAIFQLPAVHVQDLASTLSNLRKETGLRIIAADPAQDRNLDTTDLSGNICFVFGSEGWGISDEVLRICDDRVAIPMHNDVDSLNVAAASAVFLYAVSTAKTPRTPGQDL